MGFPECETDLDRGSCHPFLRGRSLRLESCDVLGMLCVIDTVARPPICIVLTDVQMPGSMDGVQLAHHVHDRFPPTLLIVASGAIKIKGADLPEHTMFMAKPFDQKLPLH
jgi:DNA-binding NtrC family response regulator